MPIGATGDSKVTNIAFFYINIKLTFNQTKHFNQAKVKKQGHMQLMFS